MGQISHPKGFCRKGQGEAWRQFISSSVCCYQSHWQWLRIHNQLAMPNCSPWGSPKDQWWPLEQVPRLIFHPYCLQGRLALVQSLLPPSQTARILSSEKIAKLSILKSTSEKQAGTTLVTSRWESFKNFISLRLTSGWRMTQMSSTQAPNNIWINLGNLSGNFSRESQEGNSWMYLGWELLTANPLWKHNAVFCVYPFLCYAWLLAFCFKCIRRFCCLPLIHFYYLQSWKNILQFIRGDLDNQPFFLCLPLLPII